MIVVPEISIKNIGHIIDMQSWPECQNVRSVVRVPTLRGVGRGTTVRAADIPSTNSSHRPSVSGECAPEI